MEYFINAQEISEVTGMKSGHSYKLIRIMNDELKDKGFMTVRGKVPRTYFYERMGLSDIKKENENG